MLHALDLSRRLISFSTLTSKGMNVSFMRDLCVISLWGEKLTEVRRVGKLYSINAEAANCVLSDIERRQNSIARCNENKYDLNSDSELCHERLKHIAINRLPQMQNCAMEFHDA